MSSKEELRQVWKDLIAKKKRVLFELDAAIAEAHFNFRNAEQVVVSGGKRGRPSKAVVGLESLELEMPTELAEDTSFDLLDVALNQHEEPMFFGGGDGT
jgi:hypothetical protein